MPAQEIVRLPASTPRRSLAAGMLGMLAGLVAWTAAVVAAASPAYAAALALAAVAVGWTSWRLWQASGRDLVLTTEGLTEDGEDGRRIARLDQIEAVDRGAFAFKPSNGFLLRLAPEAEGARAWAPGLWWRLGRRVGVGGTVRAAPARAMAEAIAIEIARREDA